MAQVESQDPAAAAVQLQEAGLDLNALFERMASEAALDDQATRRDTPVAGDPGTIIELSEADADALGSDLTELCDAYDLAMTRTRDVEREIRDNYAQIPSPQRSGTGANAALMASAITMSRVDQAAARLTTPIIASKPLIRVDPILSERFFGEEAFKMAGNTQQFMNAYAVDSMKLLKLIPQIILRATKVGTAVLRVSWEDQKRTTWSYGPASRLKRHDETIGRCRMELIDNQAVIVWPPQILDWQEAVICGHERFVSHSEWKAICRKYGLGKDAMDWPLADGETSKPVQEEADRAGISTGPMQDQKLLPEAKITELWCHLPLPGQDEAIRFQAILYRQRRKLLYIGHNPHLYQDHPYYPVRYKIGDNSAWGTGVGHEVIDYHGTDSALWNLQLDNLMASAYWVVLRRIGGGAITQSRVGPGSTLWVEDTDKDFVPKRLGGDASDVGISRNENSFMADIASGLPPVSMGLGDPTQKSGAGTGSTLALIEQANLKLRQVDHWMRSDFTDALACVFRRVAQYAPNGLFYRYAPEEAGDHLQLLKFIPPSGDIDSMLRFRITAPSAAGSDESRKQAYLLIWNFSMQQIALMEKYVTEYLTQENPAALIRWKRQVVEFMQAMFRNIVRYNEVQDIEELVPMIPEPLEGDGYVNQLIQEVETLRGQLEQIQQQQVAESQEQGQMGMGGMMRMGGMGNMGENMPGQGMPEGGGMPMDGGADVFAS